MSYPTKSKRDVYQIVTDKVIDLLEQGVVPWKKPWRGGAQGAPKNAISKKPYRGVNWLLLSMAGRCYENPYWLTYRQAESLGGHVRKGEKSALIVFWKQWEVEKTDNETGKKYKDTIPVLRYYNVFNVDQCEDLDMSKIPQVPRDETTLDFEPIDVCDQIVSGMPNAPEIVHSGEARAYYRPAVDRVHMPNREKFLSVPEYYSTLFHELTHATGHASRLDRHDKQADAAFGSTDYSKEELVAEMGAAYLCGMAGIETATIENSAAYIHGWLTRLRDDRKLVVMAAGQAQKAADYILAANQEGGEA